ncbi:hypothetical protein IGI04_022078 [Brassica rapa subsp. trilocularis]|uniref:Uncharacterized protein n=1 Tax=Brassica rapa subsp. trilocularis TaxID=1813537 RepID=A0ABQ7LZY8_BRACM|nr:hypothetical protein IGI04_022078 [Brassica rapa subsp. trilocularis]
MKLDPKRIVEVLEKYEAEADQIFLIRSQVTNPESSLTNMEHIVCNNRWWRTTVKLVKEKTLFLSELGALAESVPPGVIRSLVKLKDKA